jgi:predicted amidohydrolase YtcJ
MLITNGKLVTWEKPNRILDGHALRVVDDLITEIGPESEMIGSHPEEEILDAGGQYVMPGIICAHTHFYGAFARGLSTPCNTRRRFSGNTQKALVAVGRVVGRRRSALFGTRMPGGCYPAWHNDFDRSSRFAQRNRWIIGCDCFSRG